MKKASGGGGAASSGVYRHALVRFLIPLLAPLAPARGARAARLGTLRGHGGGSVGAAGGWSALSLALALLLMAWDPSPTLAQRFAAALVMLDTALPRRLRVGRTYQGFVKAMRRHGVATLDTLGEHLRELTRRAAETGKCWLVGEWVPIGADGSRFDAPRTLGNESLGFAGKDKCGPQMMTLLLVHLGAMLPWGFKAGGARDSERSLLRGVLGLLPRNALLVADAGFTGFELLGELLARDVHFLIRVGRGVELLKHLGVYRREGKHTVYLRPDKFFRRPPLKLRLIRLGSVYLITSVTDPRRLSRAAAGELYRRRWGLEVAFRSLKQILERRKVRSGAAANAKLELGWSIMGLWALSLLGVRALNAAKRSLRRFSLARALAAVRASRLAPVTDAALRRSLGDAVQDPYRREHPKKAWRWPHKKRPAPPGEPRITRATGAQVRQAQRLRCELTAA